MECPHCGFILAFSSCSACGGEIPAKSRYCCWCGNLVKTEEDNKNEKDITERIPCSDGSCIGTINEQSVCNICGKPFVKE